MSKRKAFLFNTIGFVITAALFSGFAVWLHPGPLLTLNETEKPLLLTVLMGAITGPALMLYVYKPGKKTLRLDVTTLVVLQALVWAGGAWLLWQERPGWLVISGDRMELIRIHEIDPDKIRAPGLHHPPPGQPHLVISQLPKNPRRQMELLVDSLSGGPAMRRRPELYSKPGPGDTQVVREHALKSKRLPKEALDRAAASDSIVLFPLIGREEAAVIALDLSDWSITDWWSLAGKQHSS